MNKLTVRHLDDNLIHRLRQRAAAHGRSVEEEAHCILRQALTRPAAEYGLGSRIVSRFSDVASDLALPQRSLPSRSIGLDELN